MGQTEISTKANTLYAIRDLLTKSYVEDLMITYLNLSGLEKNDIEKSKAEEQKEEKEDEVVLKMYHWISYWENKIASWPQLLSF